MIEEYSEDRRFEPPDEKPHNEGILLFSNSKSCYDDDIENILESIKPDITEYGNTIVFEPHGDGLDLMYENSVEAEKYFITNSLWLIHHQCILEEEIQDDFGFCINHTPPRTMILIWIDGTERPKNEVEREIQDAINKDKVEIVKSKEVLKHLIKKYLGKDANPKLRREDVITWNNNVHRLLNMRC